MSTLARRLSALEKLLAPQPDRWAELARVSFPVPMTLALLDDWSGGVAKARAEHVAQGHVLNDNATPAYFFRDEADSEAVAMEQQRRLVEAGAADVARAEANAAAKAQAEHAAKHPPKAKRTPKPPPAFSPSIFARN